MLLPETSLDASYAVAERLRHKVSELSFNDNGELISVTVSLGVSHLYTNDEDTLNRLLKRADEALYAAKEGGRNRVVVYGEDNSQLT
jgi:diguanylate cyclase (GGDEF)-like protein